MNDKSAADIYRTPALVALARFGVEIDDLTLISVSENVTFRAFVRGEVNSYVLRLHRPGYHSLEELNSERGWLQALTDAGIAVPHPLPTPDRHYYVPVPVPAAKETRFAGLSKWIEGDIVAELGESAENAADLGPFFPQLGQLMARMHNQASAWTPPPTFRRHRLDIDGLLGQDPFWGPFWDHPVLSSSERHLLVSTRDRLRGSLERYGQESQTFSMIHADLHLANLLTHEDQLTAIDFDDAGFGWHQYDIAVALFHSRHIDEFEMARRSFLDAYRAIRPITDDDLALVPMFELIRGMALIGWKAQRPEVQWPEGRFDALKDQVLRECATIEPR
jgi:Ser/Thr protein kinase RdoA (MazF antagonist)